MNVLLMTQTDVIWTFIDIDIGVGTVGRTFNGKEAEAMGLVLKCYDTYDEMMKSVTDTARIIANKSPITIRLY